MRKRQTITVLSSLLRRLIPIIALLIGVIALLLQVGVQVPQAQAKHTVNGTPSFTIDGNFISKAEQSAQQTESTCVQSGSDCANWISTFLETSYRMPSSLGNPWTD